MVMQASALPRADVPRPEYPRPDWQRANWLNLNGEWAFTFDALNEGLRQQWQQDRKAQAFDRRITVPFSWANPLSGIGSDEKGVGWYRREVAWTPDADGARVFLRFGAVDYRCDVWVNETHVGEHTGGYGAFDIEVTDVWRKDAPNAIVVRAEDNDLNHQARGKQGYGEIRGIWQPVWLEARPRSYVKDAKFKTKTDGKVEVCATIVAGQGGAAKLSLLFGTDGARDVEHELDVTLQEGENVVDTAFAVAEPRLWSPDSPTLYEGELRLSGDFGEDRVSTYFGIREIGTEKFGDRSYRWLTLNGKPVYLNGALDQSYHAEGHFTYPSDEAMREEIYLLKRLGLNFVRIHIKPEEPRKLYWADKLGMLVMEDMPCFWGNPDETARAAYESEAREIILRDYNHPSIISWVMFNETWGLKTEEAPSGIPGDKVSAKLYLPQTQEWVRSCYRWAKQLDPTRIVEDNSPCNMDHVESDLNTWHFYINGYEQVRNHLIDVTDNTYPGSNFNYTNGNKQSDAPLMNSECGNVWGFVGGAGDSDISWHYKYMLNEYRRHDKICGFIFTEFRDVTNEFNGYYRLNGADKQFGYEAFVPGMSIADLHTPDFIVVDAPPCRTVQGGERVETALLRSSFDDRHHGRTLRLEWELWHDELGERKIADRGARSEAWDGYGVATIAPIAVVMPTQDAVAVLAVRLLDEEGVAVARNFAAFDVRGGQAVAGTVSLPVTEYAEMTFEYAWTSLTGHKINGAKQGTIAYDVTLPEQSEHHILTDVEIVFEASAKRLLARNRGDADSYRTDTDFMHGGLDQTELNPNTYPMTDDDKHESRIEAYVDGERIGTFALSDDPADSRGVLSWHYQPTHDKLDDAGSYGYLCRAVVPSRLLGRIDVKRGFRLELRASEGGLALYGRNAGRYPIDLQVRYR
ncbi:glycoside hydrolase family 2 protein [Cohnella sp. GCM10027633]|uniref:glycoside hydrolase family 2 protein n=1 Tax=unclassified Cohnella TaxID=2636738 RepID=UPI00362DC6E7